MCHGRRPTGLVGAAILIAARYHGFKRTTNQIVQTVHVCDETIRKRLVEFKQTSVARLTREEFEKIDLEKDIVEECDPPSFKRAVGIKEILKLANFEKELVKKASQIEEEMAQPEEEITEGDQGNDGNGQRAIVLFNNEQAMGEEDIDDEEINSYLLSKEESIMKSLVWHNMHKDWLEEQAIKEKKKNKNGSGVKRRKKNKERRVS